MVDASWPGVWGTLRSWTTVGDVLGMPHVRSATRAERIVEQRRLAVVDVARGSDDRRASRSAGSASPRKPAVSLRRSASSRRRRTRARSWKGIVVSVLLMINHQPPVHELLQDVLRPASAWPAGQRRHTFGQCDGSVTGSGAMGAATLAGMRGDRAGPAAWTLAARSMVHGRTVAGMPGRATAARQPRAGGSGQEPPIDLGRAANAPGRSACTRRLGMGWTCACWPAGLRSA